MEWTGARYADKPTVQETAWIDADPRRVWEVVSDIAVMPELSDELQAVEWLDGTTQPRLGARFAGRSAHPELGEWETHCHITAMDPPKTFGWAVGDPEHPAAVWMFELAPLDGGTQLTFRAQLGPGKSGLSLAIDRSPDKEQKIVFVRLREFQRGIVATLSGIKSMVEGGGH